MRIGAGIVLGSVGNIHGLYFSENLCSETIQLLENDILRAAERRVIGQHGSNRLGLAEHLRNIQHQCKPKHQLKGIMLTEVNRLRDETLKRILTWLLPYESKFAIWLSLHVRRMCMSFFGEA